MEKNDEQKRGFKQVWGNIAHRTDTMLDKLPLPWLTKRVFGWGVPVLLLLLVLNWVGLRVSPFDLIKVLALVVLISGLCQPTVVLRRFMPEPQKWARWLVQGVSFVLLAVWLQANTSLQYTAVILILLLVLLWGLGYKRIGTMVKRAIPGGWDDPYVDRSMAWLARWTPWVLGTMIALLILPLAVTTHKHTFVIRDADQQAGIEEYKIYTDFGADSPADTGQTFRNVRDVRFWKYDTAGLQGALLHNKGKRVTVWATGINWAGREIYKNILWISTVDDGQ